MAQPIFFERPALLTLADIAALTKATLVDASRAALPNSTVTLVEQEKKFTLTAKTDEAGRFVFAQVAPGIYKLTVQAFGTPAKRSDTVQLSAGMQSYVQVQAVPNWEEGSRVGGWSFAVLAMSPELAQQYLPTMTYLGQR